MDINEIMDKAKIQAIKLAVGNGPAEYEGNLSDEMKSDLEFYQPIISYINALVAESIKLYHQEQQKRQQKETL